MTTKSGTEKQNVEMAFRTGFKFNSSTESLQWKGTGTTYYNCFSFSN